MGATPSEFRALVAERALEPRSRLPKIKNPWRLPDGLALVEELEHHAILLPPEATGWETIQRASKRSGLDVGHIIGAIREGRVQAGKRPAFFGYHGIVDELLGLDALYKQQMAAAAFARSIGLRDYSAFTALIEAGHIAATQVKSPKTARLQWLMSEAEIADFRKRFVTPTMITQETGLHRNTIFAVFSAAGVKPFQPEGLEAGPIYLREVAMRSISNLQKKR